MSRLIRTFEDNGMSLSCYGEVEISNENIIISKRFKGYPRANGKDRWFGYYKNMTVGEKINEEEIKDILSYNKKDNIVSVIN